MKALCLALITLLACAAPALASPGPASVALSITTLAGTAVSSVPSGTAVALTAIVTSTAGIPYPGQVMFCDATAAFCQNASLGIFQLVNTSGTAQATVRFTPGPGAHSYEAVFLGTKTYAKATSSPVSLAVTAAVSTSTTLTSSGAPGSYGLAAQISATGPAASPSGTVSFLDTTTNATLGSAPVTPGSVTFSLASPTYPGFDGPFTADLNGDGRLDVIGNPDNGVLLGNGDGTFTTVPFSVSTGATEAVGDFNNDGKLDVITNGGYSGSVSLLLGNGDGTFTIGSLALPVCSDAGAIAVGDFNHDGNADLIVSCYSSTFDILLGNGDGTFSASTIQAPFNVFSGQILVGDFNGDGNADLAVSLPSVGSIGIFLGNGDGTFQAPTTTLVGAMAGGSFLAADFNGDGKLDLAIAMSPVAAVLPQDIAVLLNNGDGTFTAPVLTPLSVSLMGLTPTFTAVDLNGDGKADLVLTDQRGLSLLFSNGDGTFTLTPTTGQSAGNGPLITGDFNGDGVPDILPGGVVYLTKETHNAVATLSNVALGGYGTQSITASYSGDSAYTASTSTAVSLSGTLIPTTLSLAATPTSAIIGTPIALTATLSPASNGNFNTNGETVTFSSGTTSLGTATLASGVAVLDTSALPTGTSSVTANFPGDGNFSASAASGIQVTVTAPPPVALSASSLTFASIPLGTTSVAQTITVTNATQSPLTFASVSATGNFAQTNTCSANPIGAEYTCTVSVTFTPVAIGPSTGTLTLVDNAANSPQQIPLSGSTAVGPVTISLALTSAGTPVTSVPSGTVVALTATLTAPSGTPSPGQVIFCEASAAFCQNASLGLAQVVNTGGTATATIRFVPGAGAHSYKAVFLGTRSYASASSTPQPLTVTAAVPTTITLTTSGLPGSYGLDAQVSGAGPFVNPSGTVSFFDTTTSVALGTTAVTPGSPTFSLGNGIPVSTAGVIAADFNGDGKLDVAGRNGGTSVGILLGNGDGTFQTVSQPAFSQTAAYPEVVADFNNDGKLDLLLDVDYQEPESSTVALLLGNGDGTFTTGTTPQDFCNYPSLATGDFNNDGNADVVAACGPQLITFLGRGDGTFSENTQAIPSNDATESNSRILVGDFNGDGNADFVLTSYTGTLQGVIVLFLGNGDGTFQAPVSIATPTPNLYYQAVAADVNGDGKLDIVTTTSPGILGANEIAVLLNNGDGTFAAPVLSQSPGGSGVGVNSFLAADLNGDGKADLIVDDPVAGLSFLLSNGDGTFTAVPTGLQASPSLAADFNGDGVPDILAYVTSASSTLYLTTETHNAAATLSNIAVRGSGTHSITAAYSGDSAYTASTSSPINLTATSIPTTLTLAATPTSATVGTPIALTATLTPASLGNLNTDGETVTFTSGATTLGTATLASGVATFNTTALPVGTDSVTASFGGDTNFAASAAPAVQVSVLSPPAVALSAPSLTFSSQTIGSTSPAQTLTVTNSGQIPLTISTIIATGDFAQTSTCSSGGIAAGGTCTVSITFTPTSAGSRSGTLTLSDNAANSPQVISLSGAGARISTALALAATPTSATAGTQIALKASLTPASLASFSTNGDTVTFTSGSTILGTAILASGIATLNTSSLPIGTDSITASFPGDTNFAASAAPATQVTVTAPLLPAVTLSTSSLTFSMQSPGSTSAAQTITLTNSGQAPLTITSLIASGDFAQTNTCTANPIAVQGTCTIAVTFTPTAAGTRTGSLAFADNAANSPQTLSLTGTGAPVALTAASSSLTIADPGGTASTTLQIAAAPGFSGTVALSCAVTSSTTTNLPPTCVVNPAQGSVSPGSPFSSTLTISSTAAIAGLSTARHSPRSRPRLYGNAAITLAGLLFTGFFAPATWRRRRLFTFLALTGLLAGLAGCGGHSSSSTPPSAGTSTGAYQVTITAVANSVSITTALNLTVQ